MRITALTGAEFGAAEGMLVARGAQVLPGNGLCVPQGSLPSLMSKGRRGHLREEG